MRCRLALIPLSLLASCGGGGGGGGNQPPVNQAPRFSSATTASVPENVMPVYQATATDAENEALTYSLSGGADRAAFTITQQGALAFASMPDFEVPRDADGDNVYLVQLNVSDGKASSTLDLRVTVTNDKEGIQVRRIATGFNQPVYVAPIPGDTRLFVLEKGGNIMLLDPATGAKSLFMNAGQIADPISGTPRNDISTDGERGLLGIAPQPDYPRTGIFYVFVTNAEGDIEIRRHQRGRDGLGSLIGGSVELRIEHSRNNNHNGGWMGFGPDGRLYIAVGDGGGAGDPDGNAQNPHSRLGKILRLEINPDPYAGATIQWLSIPSDNPYFDGTAGDRAVYALGLRNPFRASFHNGRLLIADVGQDASEEIDGLPIPGGASNFGWPFKEGTRDFRGSAPTGLIAPLTEYGHGSGPRQGASVIGGYVYRGPAVSLTGRYVFGDFVSGNIWSVPAANLVQGRLLPSSDYERRNDDFTPDEGRIDQIVSFGEDNAGNLYIVDFDGEIFIVGAG